MPDLALVAALIEVAVEMSARVERRDIAEDLLQLIYGILDVDAPSSFLDGCFDLRRSDNVLKWILIGAGIPLLIGGLVWLGILIGRRSKDKAKQDEEKPGDEFPEPDDPPAPEPTDEADQNDSE